MEHEFYFDGNPKKICWVIKANQNTIKQFRDHAETYYEKVSVEESKFIALHVGIFWGIGTFSIKDKDSVNIMIDSKYMYDCMTGQIQSDEKLIRDKIRFIFQLIAQRELKIRFILMPNEKNISTYML